MLGGDKLIGNKIKQFRKDKGLTQKELATKLGVAEITIRKYESGDREPKLDQLQKIASALDVAVEELIKGDVPITNQEKLKYLIDTAQVTTIEEIASLINYPVNELDMVYKTGKGTVGIDVNLSALLEIYFEFPKLTQPQTNTLINTKFEELANSVNLHTINEDLLTSDMFVNVAEKYGVNGLGNLSYDDLKQIEEKTISYLKFLIKEYKNR